MKHLHTAVGVLILIAAGSAPASAQSDFRFSPYLGALWLDGSCVYWSDGQCDGATQNDPGFLFGVRASMTVSEPWGIEIGYGGSPVRGDPPVALVDESAVPAIRPSTNTLPFDAGVHLYYGGVTYLLHQTARTNLRLSGLIGGITFKAEGLEGRGERSSFTDLLAGLGLGASVRLDRLILLRGDLRAYSQGCRDDVQRMGFVCDDGSVLGHAEISGGVVLAFPGLPRDSEPLSR